MLVAIRMSQTCEMPSTFTHCGVSSVMPWITVDRAFGGVHGVGSPPELVERRKLHGRPHAADRIPAARDPLGNAELFLDRGILFRMHLLDLPDRDERSAELVIDEDHALQGGAVVALRQRIV